MDGLATIQALHDIRPDLPAVLISGLHAQAMLDSAAVLGVRHVLLKPFTAMTLLQTLRDVLSREPEPGTT